MGLQTHMHRTFDFSQKGSVTYTCKRVGLDIFIYTCKHRYMQENNGCCGSDTINISLTYVKGANDPTIWRKSYTLQQEFSGRWSNTLPRRGKFFVRMYGSRKSLPRKVAWPGRITCVAAPCLSASPCRQNRRSAELR